jgi:hypothetical protein
MLDMSNDSNLKIEESDAKFLEEETPSNSSGHHPKVEGSANYI